MVEPRKYELIPTRFLTPEGKPLYQIRACRDFGDVRVGDLGGYIEGEHNLPHGGDVWVHPGTTVYGDGYISDGTQRISVAVRPANPPTKPRAHRPRNGFVFR